MTASMLNLTFEDVGQAFKENGYIVSNNSFKQYDRNKRRFVDVPDRDVLAIFKRIYPNFERRQLNLDLLINHVPNFSTDDFELFDLYKQIAGERKKALLKTIDEKINAKLEENENRKQSVEKSSTADFKSALQVLINNNVFSDGNVFYLYEKKEFKLISNESLSKTFDKLLSSHYIKHANEQIDYDTLIYQAKMSLTSLRDIKPCIELKNKINAFSKADVETVERIENLIKSYYAGAKK